jgi:hypothetical protein
MLSLHYGGGIGLAYTGLGLASFLSLVGVSRVMGGVAANAVRLTKMVSMKFNNEKRQNNALEIDIGGRSIAMVGRALAFFSAVFLSILYLGFYCKKENVTDISLFDMVFMASFVFGGSFPYMVSFVFLESVEDNTDKMMK